MAHNINIEAYDLAQEAMACLKSAIIRLLAEHPEGMKAVDIGRALGTNADFLEDQSGWLQYTVLKILELERAVEQPVSRGPWRLAGSS